MLLEDCFCNGVYGGAEPVKNRSALVALILALGLHSAGAQTISALPSGGLAQSTDWLPAVRGGVTMKVTPFNMPATGSVLISNGTAAPYGLVPVNGSCLEGVGSAWMAVPCVFSNTVTVSGTPLAGNLTKFASAGVIQAADLTGDVTTSGTSATTVAKIRGVTVAGVTGTGNAVLATAPTIGSPVISGGTIDNNTIGGTTAAAGTFTTITPTSSTPPTNGIYLPASNTVGVATNSSAIARFTTAGLGLNGASATSSQLELTPTITSAIFDLVRVNSFSLGGNLTQNATFFNASGFSSASHNYIGNLTGFNWGGLTLSGTSAFTGTMAGASITGPTLSSTASLTSWEGVGVGGPSMSGSATLPNSYGMFIANQGGAGITNSYGVNVAAQSGSTNAYPYYYASGSFYVDKNGNVVGAALIPAGSTIPSSPGFYSTGTSVGFAANSALQINLFGPASAVNYWQIEGSTTGNPLNLYASGSDSNVPVNISSQGTGAVSFYVNSNQTLIAGNGIVTANGHLANGVGTTSAPTCGTGCSSVTAGSTDVRGSFTTAASVTSAILNFGTTWASTPVCTISDNSTAAVADINAITTGALTINFASSLSGVKVYYICIQ
jgi:hypothetical protein